MRYRTYFTKLKLTISQVIPLNLMIEFLNFQCSDVNSVECAIKVAKDRTLPQCDWYLHYVLSTDHNLDVFIDTKFVFKIARWHR
jgi:hypothetical protein